jgi:hypothetical protein
MVSKARAAAAVAPVSKTYVLRVWADFEKTLKGMDFSLDLSGDVFAPLAVKLRVNDRLYLQVWEGGQAVSRSRVIMVREIRAHGTEIRVEQTWGWKKCAPAIDVSLTMFSLKAESDQYPVYPAKTETTKGKPEPIASEESVDTFVDQFQPTVVLAPLVPEGPAPVVSSLVSEGLPPVVPSFDALKNLLGVIT